MRVWLLLIGAVLTQPGMALGSAFMVAQSESGSLSGVVRDVAGIPLAGVTVEASSPVLIEGSRTAVTDDDGLYKIVGLRSGFYTVTFTRHGFHMLKSEGIEVTSSFNATINASMQIGTVEEAVAVSAGAAPLDTQNVTQKALTTRQAMDTLPSDRTFISFAAMTPGMVVVGGVQNVGGSNPENALMLRIHGSRIGESRLFVDGMSVMSGNGTGGLSLGNFLNNAMAQEIVVSTDAMSAEFELSGVTSNVITRQGSNALHGSFIGRYTSSSLQSENLSDDLIARGLTSSNRIKKIWDVNPSIGGPIVSDRAWIFSSVRHWGTYNYIAGLYEDVDPTALFYTPDLDKPAIQPVWHASGDARLTVQATPRNKIAAYYHVQRSDFGTCLAPTRSTAPSACAHPKNDPQWFGQASWSAPVSPRLLIEAGATITVQSSQGRRDSGVPTDLSAITDTNAAVVPSSWRAPAGGYGGTRNNQSNYRASASLVTGRHALKVGLTLQHQWRITGTEHNNSVNYTFNNGGPSQLTQFAEPATFAERVNYNLGLYAQDQWTVKRLTLNLGLRADFLNSQVDAQHLPAGPLIGERDFPEINDVPNWKDLSPRLGAAYDLFGTGKTALKATLARYINGESYNIARVVNPVESMVSSTTRLWNDRNGNFTPDCDLRDVEENGECGPAADKNFGRMIASTTYDQASAQGFGVRPYNWGVSLNVQHELFPRVSVSAGYFRRWYGNFTVAHNRAVTNADFTTYCVTVLENPRLPGGGGHQQCGFYDVNPGLFGKVDNFITNVSNFGRQEEVFDGFDFTVNARLPSRAVVNGGVSLGRQRTNICYGAEDRSLAFLPTAPGSTAPRTTSFCDIHPPMQPNLKVQAAYPLPWWAIQAAATFQSLPGTQILAQQSTSNQQIRQSLGRNLSSCGEAQICSSRVTLDVLPPGTLYGDRINQIDLRVSKTVRWGRTTIRPTVSVYNLLNASPVLQYRNAYGPTWPAPTTILTARFVDFGVQVDF